MDYCVLGSINMDLVSKTPHFVNPGETLSCFSFSLIPGGKGANQAVALSKLGAKVTMLGKMGNDIYGDAYQKNFIDNNVKTDHIERIDSSTGLALIEVEESTGLNRIIIVGGANAEINLEYLNSKKNIINKADVLLLQLEIPLNVVFEAAKLHRGKGQLTILDPAPAQSLPNDLYPLIDYITPNETETFILTGVECKDEKSIRKAADILLEKDVKNVIIKIGKIGAYFSNKDTFFLSPSYPVKTIDSTAAGDSFNAGLAFALQTTDDPSKIMKIANAVASLSTTGFGAQSSMPSWNMVEKLLLMHPNLV